jgi:hypothetical protein
MNCKLTRAREVLYFGAYIRIVLKRRELETTLTELSAIAAAAKIGLRNPKAASGIPIAL